MTEWIDCGVYALLIVTVWFVLPAWHGQFAAAIVRDRNPDWVTTHPGVASKLEREWSPAVYYVWGGISLLVLLAFQTGVWPARTWTWLAPAPKWEALKDLNSTLLLPGLAHAAMRAVRFRRSLVRLVPLAERRRASLQRRTLDDFVPRTVQIATHALTGGVLMAWLVVGTLQLSSSRLFWARFMFLAALTAVIEFCVRLGVNRRPGALDRIFGPGFRAREVRLGFLAHALPPAIGAVRLYEEVTAAPVPDALRVLHLVIPVFVVLCVWRLSSHARQIAVA